MMDKLSNPVAFTSTPLHETDEPILKDPTLANNTNPMEENDDEISRIEREMQSISQSFFLHTTEAESDSVYTHKSDESIEDYQQENQDLKLQIKQLTDKIQHLEKQTIDSTVLKSSIVQFKNDVHKEALRIFQTQDSTMMTRSATTTGSPLSKNIRTAGSSTAEMGKHIRYI